MVGGRIGDGVHVEICRRVVVIGHVRLLVDDRGFLIFDVDVRDGVASVARAALFLARDYGERELREKRHGLAGGVEVRDEAVLGDAVLRAVFMIVVAHPAWREIENHEVIMNDRETEFSMRCSI